MNMMMSLLEKKDAKEISKIKERAALIIKNPTDF